jgi:hypothetical protein
MRKSVYYSLIQWGIVLFPLILMAGGLYFCTHQQGFSVDKITSRLSYNEAWETPSLSYEQREYLQQQVFPQTFYYLASGKHCYAFVSEDQKYVLKFFKMQNLMPKDLLQDFPSSLIDKLKNGGGVEEQLLLDRMFLSYKATYEHLRQEAGLIFIHFNKTHDLQSHVTLVDGKGKKYEINLDLFEFVVQYKAEKIYERLHSLVNGGNEEKARKALRSFFQLIALRCEKGFVDQDISIRNNYGFIGDMAVQVDCGTLLQDKSMSYPVNFRSEIMHVAERLDLWALQSHPELSLLVQEEAQRVINESFSSDTY